MNSKGNYDNFRSSFTNNNNSHLKRSNANILINTSSSELKNHETNTENNNLQKNETNINKTSPNLHKNEEQYLDLTKKDKERYLQDLRKKYNMERSYINAHQNSIIDNQFIDMKKKRMKVMDKRLLANPISNRNKSFIDRNRVINKNSNKVIENYQVESNVTSLQQYNFNSGGTVESDTQRLSRDEYYKENSVESLSRSNLLVDDKKNLIECIEISLKNMRDEKSIKNNLQVNKDKSRESISKRISGYMNNVPPNHNDRKSFLPQNNQGNDSREHSQVKSAKIDLLEKQLDLLPQNDLYLMKYHLKTGNSNKDFINSCQQPDPQKTSTSYRNHRLLKPLEIATNHNSSSRELGYISDNSKKYKVNPVQLNSNHFSLKTYGAVTYPSTASTNVPLQKQTKNIEVFNHKTSSNYSLNSNTNTNRLLKDGNTYKNHSLLLSNPAN